MDVQYVWRGWSPGVAADVAAKELERIRKRDNGVDAAVVVNEARPEAAPLHPAFEWDDAKAGEQYRIIQSRTLIRSVRRVDEGNEAPVYVSVRAIESAEAGDERKRIYQPLARVVEDEDELASAIAYLATKLTAAQVAIDEVKAAAKNAPATYGTLAAISEALATARELASNLRVA